MTEIKVYNDIVGGSGWSVIDSSSPDPKPVSLDYMKTLLAASDKEVKLLINSNGGSVYEAMAIYDLLRTSGKTLHAHIEGSCHSAATILLLAAPIENRTANPNIRALVHEAYFPYEENLTIERLDELKVQLNQDRESVIAIYADRTGKSKEEMSKLMGEERFLTAAELKEQGFISKILGYTTNHKKATHKNEDQMSQKAQEILLKANSVLDRISRFFKMPVNFAFVDADGNILFETDKEDDSLAVGDAAFPDGTFTLPDGRKVTIVDGVVTMIADVQEQEMSSSEELQAANDRIALLEGELSQCKELLKASADSLNALKASMQSTATMSGRQGMQKKCEQGKNNRVDAAYVKEHIGHARVQPLKQNN